MRIGRFLQLFSLLALGLLTCAAANPKLKFKLEFVAIQFPAPRETKAVELALLRSASDAALKARFDAGRTAFDQGILKLNAASEPTQETLEFFTQQAAARRAIAEDPALPETIRAAALHNVANCHTVNRRYDLALEAATTACALDPKQKRYAIERNAIRDGFYAKRTGYAPANLEAPRLEATDTPRSMEGLTTGIELSAPLVKITPYRTLKEAVGFIWVNGRKAYKVAYQEKAELDPAPLTGMLTLHNQTERVIDGRGVLVQVSLNGNAVGGPAELRWQNDPSRIIPGGKATAAFAVIKPHALPAEGTLSVAVFDVPSAVSATGTIEAKRNDTYGWTVSRTTCSFEVLNRMVEEKVTEQDALSEGRAIAQKPRFERLSPPTP